MESKSTTFSQWTTSISICPYVFLNAELKYLGFFQITNSLIFKNQLEFINIDDDIPNINSIGLNIHYLTYLEISIIFEDLTTKNMCPHIFKTIHNLAIIGSPNSIQTNLFAFLPQIEHIILNIDNLAKFLHQGIDWMTHLNEGLRVNSKDLSGLKRMLSHIKIININEINDRHLTRAYTYPDEDLCLFRNFPHKQLVIPFLPNLDELDCTCTIVWLVQNYKIYSLKYNKNYSIIF